jgi:hypothetical protein
MLLYRVAHQLCARAGHIHRLQTEPHLQMPFQSAAKALQC